MRRHIIPTTLCALLLALVGAGAAAASPAPVFTPGVTFTPATVATFDPGAGGVFAEGMAADRHGDLYVSLTAWGDEANQGQIWKISPSGRKHLVATIDLAAFAMLTGVALDRCDAVYVGVDDASAAYGEEPVTGSGVWRVRGSALVQAVALPEAGMPNGLAFHGGDLYVTDSLLGAVWRAHVGVGVTTVTQPWLQNDLLAPGDPTTDPTVMGLGANGIAFDGDRLFVDVSDFGRVVRVPMRWNGSAGSPVTVFQSDALKTADGMAFDARGRLWITVNAGTTGAESGGGLYRLSPRGRLVAVADDPGWLDYPTTPVFAGGRCTRDTLYVENGSYASGTPTVVALTGGHHRRR